MAVETVIVLIHPLPFVNYIVHVWGLDTYCPYSSDGFIAVNAHAPLTLTPRLAGTAAGVLIRHCAHDASAVGNA
eukprot:3427879-Rhodomonas_salina.1